MRGRVQKPQAETDRKPVDPCGIMPPAVVEGQGRKPETIFLFKWAHPPAVASLCRSFPRRRVDTFVYPRRTSFDLLLRSLPLHTQSLVSRPHPLARRPPFTYPSARMRSILLVALSALALAHPHAHETSVSTPVVSIKRSFAKSRGTYFQRDRACVE